MQTLPPLWVLVPLVQLAVVTGPLVVADVRALRLPNALVLPGFAVLGWALAWAAFVTPAVAGASVVGAVALGGVLLAGRMLGGVGMGDVKLGAWLGGIAGMTGVLERPDSMARGALVAAAVAVATLFVTATRSRAATGRRSNHLPTALRIPFGPPLLAAFWSAILPTG